MRKAIQIFQNLRACLKRADSPWIEEIDWEYENKPNLSKRSHGPSMGLYQRLDSGRKARRPSTHIGNASRSQCHLVSGGQRVPVAHVAARVSSLAKRVHVLPAVA